MAKIDEDARKQAILDLIEKYDVTTSAAWDKLDQLSTHTHIDTIEADPEGIIIDSDKEFHGIANIYVSLEYGSKKDSFTTSDSFIGRFKGVFDQKNKPVIQKLEVDTSSFYE